METKENKSKEKFRLVGKIVDGTHTAGYKVSDLASGKEMSVKKDVMAYLVGAGAV